MEGACLPSSEENFPPAVKLRPQTPPIDKREIGDAAIPGGTQSTYFSLSPAPSPPPTTRAISE